MRITRRDALRGGTAVATCAAVTTAADVVASMTSSADGELFALEREIGRYADMKDDLRATIRSRMPEHLRHARSWEATEAFMKAGLKPDTTAMLHEIEGHGPECRRRCREMAQIPAVTIDGVRAKLKAAIYQLDHQVDHGLAQSALRDLTRMAGRSPS